MVTSCHGVKSPDYFGYWLRLLHGARGGRLDVIVSSKSSSNAVNDPSLNKNLPELVFLATAYWHGGSGKYNDKT